MSKKRRHSEISNPEPHRVPDLIPTMECPEDPEEALRFFFGEHAVSNPGANENESPVNDWRRFIRTTPPPDPAGDVLDLGDLGDVHVQLDGEGLDLDFAHEAEHGPATFDFNPGIEADDHRPFGTVPVPEGEPRSVSVSVSPDILPELTRSASVPSPSEPGPGQSMPVPPYKKLIIPTAEDMAISAEVQEHIRNATRRSAADAQPGHETDRPAKRQKTASAAGEAGERPAKKRRRPRRKKDDPEPDYSAIVREQVRNSTRTGQACDRCKVKRMKCDTNPGSCLNCAVWKVKCQTTDLTTGITASRGEITRVKEDLKQFELQMEELEVENVELNNQLDEFERVMDQMNHSHYTQVGHQRLRYRSRKSHAALAGRACGDDPTFFTREFPSPVPVVVPSCHFSNGNPPPKGKGFPHNNPASVHRLHRANPLRSSHSASRQVPRSSSKGVSDLRHQLSGPQREVGGTNAVDDDLFWETAVRQMLESESGIEHGPVGGQDAWIMNDDLHVLG